MTLEIYIYIYSGNCPDVDDSISDDLSFGHSRAQPSGAGAVDSSRVKQTDHPKKAAPTASGWVFAPGCSKVGVEKKRRSMMLGSVSSMV